MPKVVRFHQAGGPEVLKVEEVAPAAPGPGEVRLKVQAIDLQRPECKRLGPAYDPAALARAKRFVYDGLQSGALKPILDERRFNLDQILEVHRYMESNTQLGKIAVRV